MTDSESLRRTPLFDIHTALRARMVPFAGFSMPVQYAGLVKEHKGVRTAAGLFDVSHMGELWVVGANAVAQVDRLVTNNVEALPDGKALYTLCCNTHGGILDDLIVYRLSPERILVVCNGSNRAKIVGHFRANMDNPQQLDDRSDETVLLALQGPNAQAILEAAGAPAECIELPRFRVAEGQVAELPTLVARTGYTGEDGYELFVRSEDGPALWERLMAAGAAHGLQPIGLGARDTLRLEAGLALYGNDIDEHANPYEAGLGRFVRLKGGDFLGRAALLQIKAHERARRLVGFEMRGRGIARSGYPILDAQGKPLGRVTSGAPALALGKNVGLGYVPAAAADLGTPLGIEIRSKTIEAVVCKYPFYVRARGS